MRFYKGDGSYEADEEDFEFGWWLCDVTLQDLNKLSKKMGVTDVQKWNGLNLINQGGIEDSIDFLDYCDCFGEVKVEKYEPLVKVQSVASVQETQMDFDKGTDKHVKQKIIANFIKQNILIESEKFNSIKEKLPNLVTSKTTTNKALMAIINYPEYKNLIATTSFHLDEFSEPKIPELEKSAFLKYPFVSCNFEILEKIAISNNLPLNKMYNRKKSLLEEMHPNDYINEKVNYLVINKATNEHPRTPEKLRCSQLDCLKLSSTVKFLERFLECTKLLYENLRELDQKIQEMRSDLLHIRIDLQEEDKKSARLLKDMKKLTGEITECNYLNEILFLLMGQAEKIKSNNWPFKICSRKDKELNLII